MQTLLVLNCNKSTAGVRGRRLVGRYRSVDSPPPSFLPLYVRNLVASPTPLGSTHMAQLYISQLPLLSTHKSVPRLQLRVISREQLSMMRRYLLPRLFAPVIQGLLYPPESEQRGESISAMRVPRNDREKKKRITEAKFSQKLMWPTSRSISPSTVSSVAISSLFVLFTFASLPNLRTQSPAPK